VKDAAGRIVNVILIQQDVTDRRQGDRERSELLGRSEEARHQAEEAERLASFLAEAGKVLASSLDYNQTLASVARLAVPRIADWCAVDVVEEEDGAARRLAIAHVDPSKVELASELDRKYPPRPQDPIPRTLRTGEPELVAEVDEEMLRSLTVDQKHFEIVRAMGIRSFMVVPMLARGRTLGAISLINTESGRRFDRRDMEVAQDLAHRAALAVDNARFYKDATRERAAAEAALRALAESEERFRSLSTCSPVGKFMTDILGHCTWTNPRCQLICGFTPEEALGDGWFEFVHPEDRE
jgi:GAF domain-containing protein